MSKETRVFSTPDGSDLVEVTDFRAYIQPSLTEKRTIQTAYLDLLYYDFREQAAGWRVLAGIWLIVTVGFIWFLREYLLAVVFLVVCVGIIFIEINRRTAMKFRGYRRTVEKGLEQLGVGVPYGQLNCNVTGNTGWGEMRGHTVSSLGRVRPVWKNRGFDDLCVFDMYDDTIYR